jgi:hypothetical protein
VSRKCGNFNVSQIYGPPWTVTGIALSFTFTARIVLLDFIVTKPLHAADTDMSELKEIQFQLFAD